MPRAPIFRLSDPRDEIAAFFGKMQSAAVFENEGIAERVAQFAQASARSRTAMAILSFRAAAKMLLLSTFSKHFPSARALHRSLFAEVQSRLQSTASEAMENPEVAKIFDEVADLLELQSANPFRVRA